MEELKTVALTLISAVTFMTWWVWIFKLFIEERMGILLAPLFLFLPILILELIILML